MYKAKNGCSGQNSFKSGRKGADCIIEVPPKTLLYVKEAFNKYYFLQELESEHLVCKGGLRGQGNGFVKHYKQEGLPGQELYIKLQYSIIADIAIIGRPNSGKSTLFNKLANKVHSEVNVYPYTTKNLVWGKDNEGKVLVDVPALNKENLPQVIALLSRVKTLMYCCHQEEEALWPEDPRLLVQQQY